MPNKGPTKELCPTCKSPRELCEGQIQPEHPLPQPICTHPPPIIAQQLQHQTKVHTRSSILVPFFIPHPPHLSLLSSFSSPFSFFHISVIVKSGFYTCTQLFSSGFKSRFVGVWSRRSKNASLEVRKIERG